MVPTDKELQDLFEELENMSDSGPEMAADDISIGSNPRPGLRPFFTRSKEILPAIYDRGGDNGSDSEGEAEDIDWSSETEKEREKEERKTSQTHDMLKEALAASGDQLSSTVTPTVNLELYIIAPKSESVYD
ncbi:unnamed protein product [Cylicostephanus goldi]|uniref:Uncharacterized protein n=1 Tax=Cylicostephanus goldi TaxID=71465 RepID=A0A3P6RQ86_CYLGO|nr:unnamed protein product [Cylicostephanus goldi]